jgi:hypothetical protein
MNHSLKLGILDEDICSSSVKDNVPALPFGNEGGVRLLIAVCQDIEEKRVGAEVNVRCL